MREIEQDGFITDEIYIQETPSRRGIAMEQSGEGKAVPATECKYPNCEECDDYIRHNGANYCTVPMVLNKQTWRLTADLIADLRKEIDEVKEMVYDEILGKKSSAETGNYSVGGGVLIDHTGYHKQVVRGREEWCPDGYHIETIEGYDCWVLDLDTETEQ